MKTVISFILQDPLKVNLSEDLTAGQSALSWGVMPNSEVSVLLPVEFI